MIHFEKCRNMNFYLQRSASIQPRTSPPIFDKIGIINYFLPSLLRTFANICSREGSRGGPTPGKQDGRRSHDQQGLRGQHPQRLDAALRRRRRGGRAAARPAERGRVREHVALASFERRTPVKVALSG